MFSFYGDVITNNYPLQKIDINELIDIIRSNPFQKDYTLLRSYKKGDSAYEELKHKLPRCQPNCIVKYNTLRGDNFEKNFISGSGYIYLDVDQVDHPIEFKKWFINQYRDIVTMVCLSCGGGGLSILIRINENISSHQRFKQVVSHIKTTLFKEINFDSKTDRFGIPWFISFDPEVFFNPNSILDVSDVEKSVEQGIIRRGDKNTLFYTENSIRYLSLNEIYSQILIRTPYICTSLIEVNEIDWVDLKIPRIITDGNKRRTYTRIIHILCYLNPETDPKWIFAYLYNVNRNCADPQMSYRDLLSLFNYQLNYIKSDGYLFNSSKTKSIHFHPNLNLSGHQKSSIANKINGARRSNKKKIEIRNALKQLQENNEKETIVAIQQKSGVSKKTIIKHLKNLELTNLNDLINSLLNDV
jgi:hypothetical protein